MPILHGVFYPNQQISNVVVEFLYILPDLKAAYREHFCLGMTGEFKSVKAGTDVEVASQVSHVFSPSICFFCKEGIFCHSVMSEKKWRDIIVKSR